MTPLVAFGALWLSAAGGLVIAWVLIRRAVRDEFSPERRALDEMGRLSQ